MNEFEKRERWLTLLVLIAYAAIQSVAVTATWFPADDVQELAFIRTMGSWAGLFGVDAFGLFRPVKNLLFLLFSGLEPLGMPAVRLAAIAVGVATFFPVRAFFGRVFPDRRYALSATAVWMLAPTLVSSVVWLSCVNIQLMCGLAAGAIVLHDRDRPLLVPLLLFLACVSYEMAVSVGPCIVVFDFFLRPSRLKDRRTWGRYALYAGVTLGFLLLRHFVGSVHAVNGSFANCSRAEIMLASAYLSCEHFLSWIWPFGRMAVFGGYVAGSVSPVVLTSCWAGVAGVAVLALAWRKKRPVLAFGLMLALVGFLPVSNVTGVGNGPYGDYYLGVSSFGLAAVAVVMCSAKVGRIAVVVLRAAAFVAAFHWAWLWADGDRAFFAATENFPEFFGNKIVLVTRLSDVGLWKESLQLGEEVERTVGADSGQMAMVYLSRGLHALLVTKDANSALENFKRSRKANDFDGRLQNRDYYLGCVYDDLLNDSERAEKLYASSLRGKWTVDSVSAADRLALIRAERGDLNSAVGLWRKALKIQPDNAAVSHNLAAALKGIGDDKDLVR